MTGEAATESFTYNDRASYEMLTHNVLSKKMMPVILRIEPGGETNPEQGRSGSEKFIFVLEGRVTAHVGEKTCPLSEGNTLYFDASLKHHFKNTGQTTTKIINIITPAQL